MGGLLLTPDLLLQLGIVLAGGAAVWGIMRQRVSEGERRLLALEARHVQDANVAKAVEGLAARLDAMEKYRQEQYIQAAAERKTLSQQLAGFQRDREASAVKQASIETAITSLSAAGRDGQVKLSELVADVHKIAQVVATLVGRMQVKPVPVEDEGEAILANLRAMLANQGVSRK